MPLDEVVSGDQNPRGCGASKAAPTFQEGKLLNPNGVMIDLVEQGLHDYQLPEPIARSAVEMRTNH